MSRRPILAISVLLSLLVIEPSVHGEVPAAQRAAVPNDRWQTYQSERGGFSLDVPVTWSISERLDARGVVVTTLTPPSGVAVSVLSQPDASLNAGDGDLPNTHCRPVTVAERPARACLDTISFSVSTILAGSGKTFTITTNRKRSDQALYDHILASFRIRS